MSWWNGLKFCSCKIWDRFDFWLNISNFVAAKYGTVFNLSRHVFWFLTWRNGLKFSSCKIWDRFKLCPNMAKRSQILQPQNMGPCQYLTWHGETVSNFAAAKYGTVPNFEMTCWNGLKFSAANYGIVSIDNLQMQNIMSYHVQNRYFMINNFYRNFTLAIWLHNGLMFWLVHKSMLVSYDNFFWQRN